MDRTANAGTAFKRSVGSNPTLSAMTGRWSSAGPLRARRRIWLTTICRAQLNVAFV